MVRFSAWIGGAVAALCCTTANAGDIAPSQGETSPADRRIEMARRIDALLLERLSAAAIDPAPTVDDAEFLRRVHLDLTGVVPPVTLVRSFLADERADKRARLIDELQASPAAAANLATAWRHMMIPGLVEAAQLNEAAELEDWLARQFRAGQRFDRVVADLLVATDRGPALYFTALEAQPEKLAANTARLFLGLQIECAQCHDHPFAEWKQDDFWGYAAFFARVKQREAGGVMGARLVDETAGEVMLPETEQVVPPAYPGGVPADPHERGTRRLQLAIWTVARENPFFARAVANWAWAHMFGRGIVEPVGDWGNHNPPSHPELLDALAEYFTASGCDLHALLGVLARTDAYARSSAATGDALVRPELFGCAQARPLTPEQIYDSVRAATMQSPIEVDASAGAMSRMSDPSRQQFLARLAGQSRSRVEYDGGVPQALLVMNGPETNAAASADQSRLLQALEAPFFDDRQRVDILFLAVLSRPPIEDEAAAFVEYVSAVGPSGDKQRALGDVLWALINTSEFALNH